MPRAFALVAFLGLGAARLADAAEPLHVRIDRAIETSAVGPVAPPCTDAEFVRRASIDLLGYPPTATEARAFVADADPAKRAKFVARLVDHPRHRRQLTNYLDVTLMERRPAKHVKDAEWNEFLLNAVSKNVGYAELMAEMLSGEGADPKSRGAARYVLDRDADPDLLARDVGRMYFGRDLQCAQCHDHPNVEDYAQAEYHGLRAFFARTALYTDPKSKVVSLMESAEGEGEFASVFAPATKEPGKLRLPPAAEVVEPQAPKGQEYKVKPGKDVRHVPTVSRRKLLADSLAGNRAFQRNAANRLWAFAFGRGLVHPVDFAHSDNPATNEPLLELLADELAATKFDMKKFLTEVFLTKAYARAVELPTPGAAEVAMLEARLEEFRKGETDWGQTSLTTEEAVKAVEKRARQEDKQTGVAMKAVEAAEAALKPFVQARDAANQALAAHDKRTGETKAAVAALAPAVKETSAAQAKLPKDDAVVKAATALAARLKQLQTEAESLDKQRPAVAAKIGEAQSKMAPGEKALAEARKNHEAKRQVVLASRAERLKLVEKLGQERRSFRAAERTAGEAGALVEFFKSKPVDTQARAALAALDAERTPLERLLVAADKDAAARAESATALSKLLQTAPPPGAMANPEKQFLEQSAKSLQTALAEARNQAEALRSRLRPLDQRRKPLAEAVETADRTWAGAREDAAARLSQRQLLAGLKPLSAEEFGWTVLQATGFIDAYRENARNDLTKKRKDALAKAAAEAAKKTPGKPAPKPGDPPPPTEAEIEAWVYENLRGSVGEFVNLYAAGAGQPQGEFFGTVDQALFVTNGGTIQSWIGSWADRTAAKAAPSKKPAVTIADELYWSFLNRPPTAEEVADVAELLAKRPDERAGVARDAAWALVASVEFRFNR